MTPDALEALARRVETEEPTDALTAEVLTAFGCESEASSAPDPLTRVDDAMATGTHEWRLAAVTGHQDGGSVIVMMRRTGTQSVSGHAATVARAIIAAKLRARAWEARNA